MSAAELLLALALTASPPTATPVGGDSGRGELVLRLDCRSSLGRREVTLFANGTVRLRDGAPGAERMSLGELGRSELEAVLRRLGEIDLDEARTPRDSASGDWVEKCELELRLVGRPDRRLTFSRYDSLGLDVDRLRRIAVELGEGVDPRGLSEVHLPRNYRPQVGDCLLRIDGTRFVVRGFTGDGKGIELLGSEVPLTLYLPASELAFEFSAKVACGR